MKTKVTKWMVAAMMAMATMATAWAQSPNPLKEVENLPYKIVDKDDNPVSNDVLKKRPLLLMYTGTLWAPQLKTNPSVKDFAAYQASFYNGVTDILSGTSGLSAVSVMRTSGGQTKEGRAAAGITWPTVTMGAGPETPQFDALMKLEELIRAYEKTGRAGDAGVVIVINKDGTITPIPSLEALKAKFPK